MDKWVYWSSYRMSVSKAVESLRSPPKGWWFMNTPSPVLPAQLAGSCTSLNPAVIWACNFGDRPSQSYSLLSFFCLWVSLAHQVWLIFLIYQVTFQFRGNICVTVSLAECPPQLPMPHSVLFIICALSYIRRQPEGPHLCWPAVLKNYAQLETRPE